MNSIVNTVVEKMVLFHYMTFFLIIFLTQESKSQNVGNCVITEFSQVDTIIRSCREIIVSNLRVPAKKTLQLKLLEQASLRFEGKVSFEYAEWAGPLMTIEGFNITVNGSKESILDGQGALYWDSLGGNGRIQKPVFLRVGSNFSRIVNLNLLNCPARCVDISNINHLAIYGWTIDVSDGDKNNFIGNNTDGVVITNSNNIAISNCTVKNQGDCISINIGSNIAVSEMYCSGGHGIILTTGSTNADSSRNVLSNVAFRNCTVHRSTNGIHLKTLSDGGTGLMSNIVFGDIKLSDITNFGINIEQDYENGKVTVPIVRLILSHVTGRMKSFEGSPAVPVNISCKPGGCSQWIWYYIDIKGAKNKSSCNYTPLGYSC